MNVLITGASQGIGYELVKQFAQHNTYNIVAVSRSETKLNKLKKYCQAKYSKQIHTISIDVSDQNLHKTLELELKKIKNIDILINNAGQLINKPIAQITTKEIHQLYNTNVFGVINVVKVILDLDKIKSSHIVNIGSMGGVQGSAKYNGLSIYSSTKSAIANLSECWAEELAHLKISVNCLALGAVDTDMLSKAFPDYKAQVTPSQIASYIYDFSVNGSSFYNGKVLPVTLSTP